MSEYDPRCVNCFHRSHEGKDCPYCPMPTKEEPNARCKTYARADLFVARSMARIEQHMLQSHGQLMMGLSTIFDLLAEAYPEAAQRLQVKLEEQRKKAEEEIEERQKKLQEEAEAALKQAGEEEEKRWMEKQAEEYITQTNVVNFPVQAVDNDDDTGDLA